MKKLNGGYEFPQAFYCDRSLFAFIWSRFMRETVQKTQV